MGYSGRGTPDCASVQECHPSVLRPSGDLSGFVVVEVIVARILTPKQVDFRACLGVGPEHAYRINDVELISRKLSAVPAYDDPRLVEIGHERLSTRTRDGSPVS